MTTITVQELDTLIESFMDSDMDDIKSLLSNQKHFDLVLKALQKDIGISRPLQILGWQYGGDFDESHRENFVKYLQAYRQIDQTTPCIVIIHESESPEFRGLIRDYLIGSIIKEVTGVTETSVYAGMLYIYFGVYNAVFRHKLFPPEFTDQHIHDRMQEKMNELLL